MLDIILGRQSSRRDGVSRRDFLRVGAVGALGLPALLRGEALAAPGKNRAKSVILVFLGGGLSHHDSFDLKPEAPPEVRGKYKQIDSNVPGLQVGMVPSCSPAAPIRRIGLMRICSFIRGPRSGDG